MHRITHGIFKFHYTYLVKIINSLIAGAELLAYNIDNSIYVAYLIQTLLQTHSYFNI